MAQIFHPATNTLSKVSIFGGLFGLIALFWVIARVNTSPYFTRQDMVVEQPVEFSHAHHVGGLGIDCRYCHSSVEESAFAGIPPTKTCMTCHSQIWVDSPMLAPVRESWRDDVPIPWARVHDLPDFAYFDHSIHVQRGIGCVTCHGEVDRMPLTWQAAPMTMGWCLDCHRRPEAFVRPRERVFDMEWPRPGEERGESGEVLVREAGIEKMTNCTVCHR